MTSSDQKPAGPPLAEFRFGAVAVWGGLVSPEALDEALGAQRERRARSELHEQLREGETGGDAAAGVGESGDAAAAGNLLGEVLVERGSMTPEQVRLVLRVQLQRMPSEGHLLFGRIATAKRLATAAAVERALDVQSREVLGGCDVRRLGEILVASGDMQPGDVDAVLAYQARRDGVPMTEARKHAQPADAGAEGAAEDGPRRRVFLPSGAAGFVMDNSIWIACAIAAVAAVLVAVLRGVIFG
jgi:hypothetical protein